MMDPAYTVGIAAAFGAILIGFFAMIREKDDLHRILLTDLAEILALVIIALVGTDLAEALILPGLVVGISELMAVSEVYLAKEGLTSQPRQALSIEIMDSALKRHFGDSAAWKDPGGGFFIWVGFPPGIDTRALLPAARKQKTGFQPGVDFSSHNALNNYMRLCFAYFSNDRLEQGVERLAGVLRPHLKKIG